jgi:phosphate transport system protein
MEEARHFHQELEKLKHNLLNMAALTERALDNALKAFLKRDSDLAQEVIEYDEEINLLEVEIDRLSLRLLALDQPMARDLRFIVGCMRICSDLERIADQAVNISERTLFLNQRSPLPRRQSVEGLAKISQEMLGKVISAFVDQDVEKAREVCRMDDKADDLNVKNLRHMIDYMLNEVRAVERAVHMIIISRCLERAADHATNIAESVIFIVDGVNIKHRCQK